MGGHHARQRPPLNRPTPAAGDTFLSINPATGEVLAQLRVAGAAEVDAAVAAARAAQRPGGR